MTRTEREALRKEAEDALNEWLKSIGVSYLYVDQKIETFATLFSDALKRPDFLVLLESIGMIAVDAKNYQASGGTYTIDMDDIRKGLAFEQVFRIPVWYAYYDRENPECWKWISLLKAIEVGDERENGRDRRHFVAVKLNHFESISTNEDLGKLYTHRLPSLKKIGKATR